MHVIYNTSTFLQTSVITFCNSFRTVSFGVEEVESVREERDDREDLAHICRGRHYAAIKQNKQHAHLVWNFRSKTTSLGRNFVWYSALPKRRFALPVACGRILQWNVSRSSGPREKSVYREEPIRCEIIPKIQALGKIRDLRVTPQMVRVRNTWIIID